MPHIDGVNVPEQFVRNRVNAPTLAATKAITGATNATPIVITATAHGYSNGDVVLIAAVGGNTAANGWRIVQSATANDFAITYLNGTNVAGNGTYTSGGTAAKASSTTDGVFSSRDVWVTKIRLANTTGAAITFNLTDNLDGGSAPTGPNSRYAAVSVAANAVVLEQPKPPEKMDQGAIFYASATGLQVTVEGWRRPVIT